MVQYNYFCHKECEFFPCHDDIEEDDFNCLFCFCPMYPYDDCIGQPEYIIINNKKVKDCTKCSFPHRKANYNVIVNFLRNKLY